MDKKFICEICAKNYKSYQSLWNHKHKFHDEKVIQSNPRVIQKVIQSNPIIIHDRTQHKCSFCSKIYKYKQGKWKHEQKCKSNTTEIELLKKENDEIKKNMELLKKQILELMNKNCKIHHKTLQKMKNNGTIINGNIVNINIPIVALGKENTKDLLTEDEKLCILKHKRRSLYKCIEYVHFNDKLPQFKNVLITNNRTNEAHVYDPDSKQFKIVDKEEVITDVIDYRLCDLEEILNELEEKIDERTKDIVNKVLEEWGDNEYTRKEVKLLLFNNRKKVMGLLKIN